MPLYQPVDDHWQSRLAAIEGRPEAEPVDYCQDCGEELTADDENLEARICDACMLKAETTKPRRGEPDGA